MEKIAKNRVSTGVPPASLPLEIPKDTKIKERFVVSDDYEHLPL